MGATPNISDLQEAVDQINVDVKAFEHRSERLAPWKLQVAIEGAAYFAIDNYTVPGASVGAAWLYKVLKHKIPTKSPKRSSRRNSYAYRACNRFLAGCGDS